VLASVGSEPALVVSTPGAEPVAEGGYAAALLLDGWALLGRLDLRAGEETARRWFAAAALVRPGSEGGRVIVLAESSVRQVQGLVRWDPAGLAERELDERSHLGFPPATVIAELRGPNAAVHDLLDAAGREGLPDAGDVLGPLTTRTGDGVVRALVRVPAGQLGGLVRALKAGQAVRSARKATDFVTVHVDPVQLG
jgi:primosomal protein N' (replication factor Y) (superfamily II helicase)